MLKKSLDFFEKYGKYIELFLRILHHCVILCFLLQTELAEQKKITEDYRAKLLGKNACGPFFNE